MNRSNTAARRPEPDDSSNRPEQQRMSRRRSRSPERDDARKTRMARLRAENDRDERQALDPNQPPNGTSVDNNNNNSNTSRTSISATGPHETIRNVTSDELVGLDEEEQMMKLLGFGSDGFGSTKGTKVDDNHQGAARGAASKNKARKYRQYMNRKNGFNRPLDKMA
jgi:U4/U6.U5 tri-snRNP-associated protein 3